MGLNNWTEYTGTDEQIAEIMSSKNGFIVDSQWSVFSDPNKLKIALDDQANIDWLKQNFEDYDVTKYWIIPDDPLREMKVRHAMTGQPVWWRNKQNGISDKCGTFHPAFIQPSAYEYSFTEFKE